MANSLEPQAEEDEKKKDEIFLFIPQQITGVNSHSFQPSP